ncbi:MAG TPA: hypothetical protein VLH08_00860 [Acidobacteriota bacterium]|nr:hypothetical protein [Acidobacteriota bacterium]
MKLNNLKHYFGLCLIVIALLMTVSLTQRAESARRYEYRVISITGMTELRTQSNTQQGRMKTIESLINEQTAQGYELFQADGYVLYFRK